eukprot:132735-Chlamydomonas_euryale.AAC.3
MASAPPGGQGAADEDEDMPLAEFTHVHAVATHKADPEAQVRGWCAGDARMRMGDGDSVGTCAGCTPAWHRHASQQADCAWSAQPACSLRMERTVCMQIAHGAHALHAVFA